MKYEGKENLELNAKAPEVVAENEPVDLEAEKAGLAAEIVEKSADKKRSELLSDVREGADKSVMDRLSELYDRVRGKEAKKSEVQAAAKEKKKDEKKSLPAKILATVLGGFGVFVSKVENFVEKYTPKFIKKWFKKGQERTKQAAAAIPDEVEVSALGGSVLAVVDKFGEELVSKLEEGSQHCWGWVEAVYEKSGLSLGGSPMIYNAADYEGRVVGELDFDMLQPGDHVIYHNGNSEDKGGNHSGIFVRWADREKGVAQVVSYSGGKAGVVREKPVNFNEEEIKRVRRPGGSAKPKKRPQPKPKKKEVFATYEKVYEAHEMMDASAPVFTFPKGTAARVSSGVGYRDLDKDGEFTPHPAVDIALKEGTPLIAMQDGCKVLISRSSPTAGNYVYLRMPDGKISAYLHLKELGPAVGTEINRGDVIGLVGNTGSSGGPHLHFEMQDGTKKWPNNRIDPNKYLQESFREDELAKRIIQDSNSGQSLNLA